MSWLQSARISWTRFRFNAVRPSFYREFGAALNSGSPSSELIAQYATLNVGALSSMMQLWVEGLRPHPDSLARATKPYVSPGDSIVITAAENKGGRQQGELFATYSKNLEQRREMLFTVFNPLIIPMIAALALVGVMALFRFKIFENSAKRIPLKFWPTQSTSVYDTLDFIFSIYGVSVLLALVACIITVVLAIPVLTGVLRDFLDRRVFPFTIYAQMEMLLAINVIAALIKAGEPDVQALSMVSGNASPWMAWQLEKVRAATRGGRTVLESLHLLPIAPMLSARLYMVSKHSTPDMMPELVMTACNDEAVELVRRMQGTAKLVSGLTVLTLVAVVGMLAMGVLGLNEATQNMTDAMARRG